MGTGLCPVQRVEESQFRSGAPVRGAEPRGHTGQHCQDRKQKLDLDSIDTATHVAGAPAVRMNSIFRTIRDFVLWSYERGTIQYDIMVTLILLFVFLSPLWINFNDKPVQHNPHQTEVVVAPDGRGGLVYKVDASAVLAKEDAQIRAELLQIIEPLSGEVNISKIESIRDRSGRVLAYKVWVQRE